MLATRTKTLNVATVPHMAHHDPLTGLPNRTAFAAQFATVLDRSAAAGSGFAVMCIDLDRFKEINDLFGHPAGDRVLREVSNRLLTAATKVTARRWNTFAASIEPLKLTTGTSVQPSLMA